MNCPCCGAPMHLKPEMDSFKCDYCQSVYFPEKDDEGVRVLGEECGQACPICKVPLVHAAVADIRIFYCTTCRGMLIPMQALQPLVDELRDTAGIAAVQPAANSKDLSRRIDCSNCHHPMDAHFYAGPGNVVIDSCEQCSLNWLDHGELLRIARGADDRNSDDRNSANRDAPHLFYAEDTEPIEVQSWHQLFNK